MTTVSSPKQEALCRLSDEEKNNPLLAIESFFSDYHLHEVKEEVRQLQQVAIFTDNTYYSTGRDRSNLVNFCEHLEALAEAAFLLKAKEGLFQQFIRNGVEPVAQS